MRALSYGRHVLVKLSYIKKHSTFSMVNIINITSSVQQKVAKEINFTRFVTNQIPPSSTNYPPQLKLAEWLDFSYSVLRCGQVIILPWVGRYMHCAAYHNALHTSPDRVVPNAMRAYDRDRETIVRDQSKDWQKNNKPHHQTRLLTIYRGISASPVELAYRLLRY